MEYDVPLLHVYRLTQKFPGGWTAWPLSTSTEVHLWTSCLSYCKSVTRYRFCNGKTVIMKIKRFVGSDVFDLLIGQGLRLTFRPRPSSTVGQQLNCATFQASYPVLFLFPLQNTDLFSCNITYEKGQSICGGSKCYCSQYVSCTTPPSVYVRLDVPDLRYHWCAFDNSPSESISVHLSPFSGDCGISNLKLVQYWNVQILWWLNALRLMTCM